MRGRDGGRGEAGRDIGVWSVAIKGNLSCDKVLELHVRSTWEAGGVTPIRPALCRRESGSRCLDGPAAVFSPGALAGWKAGARSHPPAGGWCEGLEIQEEEKDSIREAEARGGRPASTRLRGVTQCPRQWPPQRRRRAWQAVVAAMGGLGTAHGRGAAPYSPLQRQYGPSLHCRVKGKLYDQSVCPSNQALTCCLWVSRSRRPAIALTAGRPPNDGQLGEDGPERARDTNTRVCRMLTGRVR